MPVRKRAGRQRRHRPSRSADQAAASKARRVACRSANRDRSRCSCRQDHWSTGTTLEARGLGGQGQAPGTDRVGKHHVAEVQREFHDLDTVKISVIGSR